LDGAGAGGLKLSLDHFSSYLEFPQGGKHTFVVHNGGASFVNPALEEIDIPQIYDKFPGLQELYRASPRNAFYLCKFWVDLHFEVLGTDSFMGVDCVLESQEPFSVEMVSSVISLGKQIVEKVEILEPQPDGPRHKYEVNRAPLCDYMSIFIHKLRELASTEAMNRVLENFSSVMLIRDRLSHEILFCCAFVFEVTLPGYGPRANIYKLADSSADETGSRRYTT
jgi:transcriptional enhancer factor